MGQNEVLEWLKKQRLEQHEERFWTAQEIYANLYNGSKEPGLPTVYRALSRLNHANITEFQLGGKFSSWHISYRYKISPAKKL